MRQATLVIVCAAIWTLAMAIGQAQEVPSKAKVPANAPASAKAAPAETPPFQPAGKPAVATPVPPQPVAKPPAAAAKPDKPSDTVLRALALLDGQDQRPTVDDICEVKHYQRGSLHGFGLVLNLKAIAANKANGLTTLAGAGRMAFAYPDFAKDILSKGQMS